MKRILAVLAVVAMVVSPVLAAEEAVVVKDAGKDLTLKGKITKVTVEEKATFTLVTADAKIELPALTKEQEILDADVVVVAKGTVVEKEGKKVTTVKEIVSVKKVEAKKEEAKKEEAKKEEVKKDAPVVAPEVVK